MSSRLGDGLDHRQKHSMPAIAITIQVVTTALLWTRVASRFATRSQLGIDDAFIVIAWVLGIGLTIVVLLGTEKYGLNRHIWDLSPTLYVSGGRVGLAVEVLVLLSLCFTKVSVLMFYRRLVEGTVSRKFKFAVWAAIAFVVAYTIAFVAITFSGCKPVKALWLRYDILGWAATHEFECWPAARAVVAAKLAGALSVVTDFYSVFLPVALVLQIRISRRQTIGLLIIFGIGLLVVGAGIARTYYLGRVFGETIDRPWWTWDVFLASVIECNVAIICASAPSLKALFGRYFKSVSSYHPSASDASKTKSSTNSNYNLSKTNAGRTKLVEQPTELMKPRARTGTADYSTFNGEHSTGDLDRGISTETSVNFATAQVVPHHNGKDGRFRESFFASTSSAGVSDDEIVLVPKSDPERQDVIPG
ncbi:uncharacterized protein PV09_08410 [Verruconis gallopava]|uniref:Rhodopsin domain-containing protein n=1 Tax=Verruconis gallopava TaxID=253628 RepID=A0A0D1YGZ4_9PEZI|nr:uncharacterized protein PV09_08410 [Verruconis gallopava]KIW00067.1 hypothetical protein PV09_08410 [Verruconis gallopava]